MNLYRQYLAEQAKEEERVERELDALINSEVAKQWAKRTEQWKREREARAKLMQEVLDTRKQQIKEKCKLTLLLNLCHECEINVQCFDT